MHRLFLLLCCLAMGGQVQSRGYFNSQDYKYTEERLSAAVRAYGTVAHRIGRMVLGVSNDGTFGLGYSWEDTDFISGDPLVSCVYPKGSNTTYLFGGAFWIGAAVGRDTLVSTGNTGWWWGAEFTPDYAPFGNIVKRSSILTDLSYSNQAVSEEDYLMTYRDTASAMLDPDYFGRPHIPLNIEVDQRSYAWSYSYAEDFVLFDYRIRNMSSSPLQDVYMGIFVDGDVHFGTGWALESGWNDDICGFVEAFPQEYEGCEFLDTVNIAWIADNDGDPENGGFTSQSVRHVTGTRIVRTPAERLDVSFNWWISNASPTLDFGPRERDSVGRWPETYRDFGTGGLGTPMGDVNRYYMMRNMEFDYDQIYTASIDSDDPLWHYPNQELAGDFSDGYDTRYLLSFGPFRIEPGEVLPLSFIYVGGENFHVDPDNLSNLPYSPDLYYGNVDFSDLALNAAWAGRVYDNPGVDTDDDGYEGKVRICSPEGTGYSIDSIEDTLTIAGYSGEAFKTWWYEGDGVPDFRGASPPPAPDFWLESYPGCIRVRINSRISETSKDVFSGLADFEGFRIYIGRDERESSFSLLTSWDKENYCKYVMAADGRFRLRDIPYSLDSLRCLYGVSCDDSSFHPLDYPESNPFVHPEYSDSIFYFGPQDYNAPTSGEGMYIRRTYPDEPYPTTFNPELVDPSALTEDGYFKYFEYECLIENLLPTVLYWVNVTAFDFGSPAVGLSPLERSVAVGAKAAFPDNSVRDVMTKKLKVYVYPNPYRGDGDYRDAGLEGRTETDRPDFRVRAVHFANLPPRCTISIYSLDGDLIRRIEHDVDPSDATATHAEWNLITRNTQLTASGLYYWVVEAEGRETQIGKLVIIM